MTTDLNRRQVALAAAATWLGTAAQAQSGLPKSISLVVPNAAGGSNDVMARAVAMRLPPLLGTAVVVDNRVGAGGNVGSAYVAKSAPKDGSTWLVTINSTQTINPSLYKSTGFDPLGDFEPVAGIAVVQHVRLQVQRTSNSPTMPTRRACRWSIVRTPRWALPKKHRR